MLYSRNLLCRPDKADGSAAAPCVPFHLYEVVFRQYSALCSLSCSSPSILVTHLFYLSAQPLKTDTLSTSLRTDRLTTTALPRCGFAGADAGAGAGAGACAGAAGGSVQPRQDGQQAAAGRVRCGVRQARGRRQDYRRRPEGPGGTLASCHCMRHLIRIFRLHFVGGGAYNGVCVVYVSHAFTSWVFAVLVDQHLLCAPVVP